jgi:hypothetical protein
MRRTYALGAAICCLTLAATTAMADLPWAWMPLDSTPFPVGDGAHITYGSDRIWGMFPMEDSFRTYVWYYYPLPDSGDIVDPNVGQWDTLPSGYSEWLDPGLAYTGMTYQWGKALYVIGADTSIDPPDGGLSWYELGSGWDDYDIVEDPQDPDHEFVLEEGACIAYAPNLDYDSANQVEGYIYCLPGGSQFWRYSIGPDTGIVVGGIFPPDGSTIADRTPKFQWVPGSSNQYRLQVSMDLSFSGGTFVIDTVVGVAEFQGPSNLADTMYGWRVGVPYSGGWLWGLTRIFAQQGGFKNVGHPIPQGVAKGASMAYSGGLWENDPSIIVLNGYLGDGEARYFHRWSIKDEEWSDLSFTDPAPMDEMAGTSLTTGDPVAGLSGRQRSVIRIPSTAHMVTSRPSATPTGGGSTTAQRLTRFHDTLALEPHL